MNLVATLVFVASVVSLAAVEVATRHETKFRAATWRTAVWLPTVLALALLWREHGASMWIFLASCGVQPVYIRGFLLKHFGLADAATQRVGDQIP